MNQTQRFMAAFKGFEYAHGQTKIQEERVAGKQKANSRIIREPLTEELVESHLKGILGVGSIPINENNKCSNVLLAKETVWVYFLFNCLCSLAISETSFIVKQRTTYPEAVLRIVVE